MAFADFDHIPKAPVGVLLQPPPAPAPRAARSTSSRASLQGSGGGGGSVRRDPGARSRATSRSSTPAPSTIYNHSEHGNSAHTSPGSSSHHAAASAPAALTPEAMAAALRQIRTAYSALHAVRSGLGGVGRALGLPHPLAQPEAEALAGSGGGGEGGGHGAMDPKPPHIEGSGSGAAAAAAAAAAASAAAPPPPAAAASAATAAAQPPPHPPLSSLSSAASLLGGGSTDGLSLDGSERSLKTLYEEAVAAKRKLVQDLKAAREEAEGLRNKNVVLEQRLNRLLHTEG